MSLAELRSLVPAPVVVPEYDFDETETALGFVVPGDYRELMTVYGAGSFGGYLGIAAPTVEDLVECAHAPRKSLVDTAKLMHESEWILPDGTTAPVVLGDDVPLPYFPCGGGPGGEDVFWHMSSEDPNEWAVVTFGSGWLMDYHPGGLVAYLTDLISGRFPSGVFSVEAVEEMKGAYCPRQIC